jgi:hypothetical protein
MVVQLGQVSKVVGDVKCARSLSRCNRKPAEAEGGGALPSSSRANGIGIGLAIMRRGYAWKRLRRDKC